MKFDPSRHLRFGGPAQGWVKIAYGEWYRQITVPNGRDWSLANLLVVIAASGLLEVEAAHLDSDARDRPYRLARPGAYSWERFDELVEAAFTIMAMRETETVDESQDYDHPRQSDFL